MAHKCRICDKEYEKVGSRNLHERHCKIKHYEKLEQEKKDQANDWDKDNCNHQWRLLGNSGLEGNARNAGFKKLCVKCNNVE